MATIKYGKHVINDVSLLTLYTDTNTLLLSYALDDGFKSELKVQLPKRLKLDVHATHISQIIGCGDIIVDGNIDVVATSDIVAVNGWLPLRERYRRSIRVFTVDSVKQLPKIENSGGVRANILYINGNLRALSYRSLIVPVSTKIHCGLVEALSSDGKIAVKGDVKDISSAYNVYVKQKTPERW